MPGAGRINDGVCAQGFRALAVLVTYFERRTFAPLGLQLVEGHAADVGDAARRANVRRYGGLLRKRFEVALNQFGAGRILRGVRGIPTRTSQQPLCRTVDA